MFKTEMDQAGIENNVLYPEQLDPQKERDKEDSVHSETETTSFTNVSYGEMSPFEQYDTDQEAEDDLDSVQVTLEGSRTPLNLVSVNDGDRQVRYYTSMSLLSKLTKYFK